MGVLRGKRGVVSWVVANVLTLLSVLPTTMDVVVELDVFILERGVEFRGTRARTLPPKSLDLDSILSEL